jgi:hypothetical protein
MLIYISFRNAVHSEVQYVVGEVSTSFLFQLKIYSGLWSQYRKLPTPVPQFLQLKLLHKISICINNGKPIRHFIATTSIIRLLF